MTFITLEGIEGSGKSSLRSQLVERVRSLGREVIATREPGATPLGQTIRQIILGAEHTSIVPQAELLLFSADRAQHVAEVIRPALARKAVVLCDRYVHSTLAYQGYGRGMSIEELLRLNQLATSGVMPDRVFLLDVPVSVGLQRARERLSESKPVSSGAVSTWNRFEEQPTDFHERVRQGFLELARSEPDLFVQIDGTLSQEDVADAAWSVLREMIS